jgi:hypothetical protein
MVNLKFFLCLSKNRTMKAYRICEGNAPCILNPESDAAEY